MNKRILLYIIIAVISGAAITELPHTKHYQQDALVERLDTTSLSQRSAVIFTGTVTKKLGTIREQDATGEDMVYSRWLIQPDRTLKGASNRTVVVRTLGGQYLTTIVEVEDQPKFSAGEKVLLFLQQPEDWKGDFRTVGEFQGKYSLNSSSGQTVTIQAETGKKQPLSEVESDVAQAL